MTSGSYGSNGPTVTEDDEDLNTSQSQHDARSHLHHNLAPKPSGSPNTDEENPLLGNPETSQKVTGIWSVIAVLLLGEFIANADSTIIMAAAGPISSQFDRLQDANWLSTAYTLGLCASQPLYGRLSDIYGRKPLLFVSYILLMLGSVISGIAQGMFVLDLGRIIGGMGGAGISVMSAIIITDIVPKREVATWRAYVNISMTLGRSVGGPLGGWLTDTIGWRWLFLLHVPLLAVAATLVLIFLREVHHPDEDSSSDNSSSIRRIDFLGTFMLATAIVAIILLLDGGGQAFPWISAFSIGLGVTGIITIAIFIYWELYIASEPILDLRIFKQSNVVQGFLIGGLQLAAQVGMMFTVPLYFQVVMGATSTEAGVHLIPAVLGNTIGGLMAGFFIRSTGRYKPVLILAGVVASITYVLLFFRWNGHTGFWESLYIIPGGMGTAFALAATFISTTSAVEPEKVAMATGGYILFCSFASTAGVTAVNTVLGVTFKSSMQRGLRHNPDMEKIIHRAMSDKSYIASLTGRTRRIVVQSYLSGLRQTYVLSFVNSILGSIIAWTVKDRRL